MSANFEVSDFVEYMDPTMVRVDPLPVEYYKVSEPWQVLWEVRDPEDRYFGFVKLDEGRGATPATALTASQFDFEIGVKAAIRKAREVNEGQNFDRDRIYLINALRTSLARIVLPKDEVAPFYKLGQIEEGQVFYD